MGALTVALQDQGSDLIAQSAEGHLLNFLQIGCRRELRNVAVDEGRHGDLIGLDRSDGKGRIGSRAGRAADGVGRADVRRRICGSIGLLPAAEAGHILDGDQVEQGGLAEAVTDLSAGTCRLGDRPGDDRAVAQAAQHFLRVEGDVLPCHQLVSALLSHITGFGSRRGTDVKVAVLLRDEILNAGDLRVHVGDLDHPAVILSLIAGSQSRFGSSQSSSACAREVDEFAFKHFEFLLK